MPEIILDKGSKKFSYITASAESENMVFLDSKAKVSNIFFKNLSENETAVFGDYNIYIFYKYKVNTRKINYKTAVLRRQFAEIVALEKNKDVQRNEEAKAETIIAFEPSCIFNLKTKHVYTSSWQIEVFGDIEVKHIINIPSPAIEESNAKEAEVEILKSAKEETEKEVTDPQNFEILEACNNESDKSNENLEDSETPESCKEADDGNVITPPKTETSKIDREETNVQMITPIYVKTSPEVIEADDDEIFYFYGDGEHSIEALMNMDLNTLRKIAESNKHSQ